MSRLRETVKGLFRKSEANLPILAAFLAVPLTVFTGGAIDLVQYERARIALQDAMDRGVLAATSLVQKQDAQTLIQSYLKTVPYADVAKLTVDDQNKINSRKVTATAEIQFKPSFLKLAGIDSLKLTATSAAQESRPNIEMSVVLDISGSMYDNGGMVQLKPAAKSFLDVILKEDVRSVTSVSIVPFAGTVNVGYDAFNLLSGYAPMPTAYLPEKAGLAGDCTPNPLTSSYKRLQCYSSCFEFSPTDFDQSVPNFPLLGQAPHFSVYNISAKGKKPWWCPVDVAAITYPTNDLAYLKAQIDELDPYDGTGTAYGMKWGELLLNPAMRSTISTLGGKGYAPIPASFRNRPADFSSEGTRKFIVLMTDGQIGFQPRPFDPTTKYVLDRNVNGSNSRTVYGTDLAAAFYKKVCNYSKKEGIVIFTIAFKVSADIAATIAECASDPSYAYKVDGLDMSSAFQSIATTIQKTRLVQ